MSEITRIKAYPIELPLRNPFETARGLKTSSPSVVIEIGISNGVTGLGSSTPVEYVTGESVDSVVSAVDTCESHLLGTEITSRRALLARLSHMLPDSHSARAGMEMAVLDAWCRFRGISMYEYCGGLRPEVETDLTIPITTPEDARQIASEAASCGFAYLKMKVGGPNVEEDLARVIAAHEGAPGCGIRLDANQGFTPDDAVEFIHKLDRVGVSPDIFEQPVHRDDSDGLAYVTRNTSVPVFADESVLTASDALDLIRMEAVDGINVKLMKSGISGALDIIAICHAAGKDLMLGCMIESGIGISTAVHLACGTGAFSRIDLDAHLLVVPCAQPFSGGFHCSGSKLVIDADVVGHGVSCK